MVAVAAAMHQVRSAPDDIRKTVSPPEVVDVDAVVPEGSFRLFKSQVRRGIG